MALKRHAHLLFPLSLACATSLAGCNGSIAPPPAVDRLYVTGDAVPANAFGFFNAPLSASSHPAMSIATATNGTLIGATIASGNVIVSDQKARTLNAYAPTTLVLQSTVATPFAPGGVASDVNGNLYVTDTTTGAIDAYTGPFSKTSTRRQLVGSLAGATGLCIDGQADLYAVSATTGTVWVLPPPYTAPPTTVSTGAATGGACAVDGTTNQLIVAVTQGSGSTSLLVYPLPLTANPLPTAIMPFATTALGGLTVDSSGLLYVGVGATAIQVYRPPLSGDASPSISIALTNTASALATSI